MSIQDQSREQVQLDANVIKRASDSIGQHPWPRSSKRIAEDSTRIQYYYSLLQFITVYCSWCGGKCRAMLEETDAASSAPMVSNHSLMRSYWLCTFFVGWDRVSASCRSQESCWPLLLLVTIVSQDMPREKFQVPTSAKSQRARTLMANFRKKQLGNCEARKQTSHSCNSRRIGPASHSQTSH